MGAAGTRRCKLATVGLDEATLRLELLSREGVTTLEVDLPDAQREAVATLLAAHREGVPERAPSCAGALCDCVQALGGEEARVTIRTGLLPSFHLEAGGPRGPMDVELSASDAIALLLDSGLPPCLELAAEPNWDREGLEDPGPAEEHRDDHRAGERS